MHPQPRLIWVILLNRAQVRFLSALAAATDDKSLTGLSQ
jgi:hypothetical protein